MFFHQTQSKLIISENVPFTVNLWKWIKYLWFFSFLPKVGRRGTSKLGHGERFGVTSFTESLSCNHSRPSHTGKILCNKLHRFHSLAKKITKQFGRISKLSPLTFVNECFTKTSKFYSIQFSLSSLIFLLFCTCT